MVNFFFFFFWEMAKIYLELIMEKEYKCYYTYKLETSTSGLHQHPKNTRYKVTSKKKSQLI